MFIKKRKEMQKTHSQMRGSAIQAINTNSISGLRFNLQTKVLCKKSLGPVAARVLLIRKDFLRAGPVGVSTYNIHYKEFQFFLKTKIAT